MECNDLFDLIKDVLSNRTDLGPVSLERNAWMERYRTGSPMVIVSFDSVEAASRQAVYDGKARLVSSIADLLSLERGNRVRLLAHICVEPTAIWTWIATPTYRGNLLVDLPGHVTILESHLQAVISQPRLSYYVSLLNEAMADDNPDFRYVRFWHVPETIAGQHLRGKQCAVEGEKSDTCARLTNLWGPNADFGLLWQLQEQARSAVRWEIARTARSAEELRLRRVRSVNGLAQ